MKCNLENVWVKVSIGSFGETICEFSTEYSWEITVEYLRESSMYCSGKNSIEWVVETIKGCFEEVGIDSLGEDGREILGGLVGKYFGETFKRIGDFSLHLGSVEK